MPTPVPSEPATPLPARRVAAVLLAATLAIAAVSACRDDPASPGAGNTGTRVPPTAPVEGTAAPAPPAPKFPAETAEQADARMRIWRADLDKQARAVLTRFRKAAYDPSRDGGLKTAAGTIDVTVDGKAASYAFAFDGTANFDVAPTTRTLREDPGIHADAARQARRFAVFATRGPSAFVLSYSPPVEYYTTQTKDGHTLVVAPPFQGGMSTSYRLSRETGLVEMSGATDGKSRVRTVFHWSPVGPLWRLTRAVIEGGATAVDYEFETRDGIELLRHASIEEGVHTYDAKVTWESITKR